MKDSAKLIIATVIAIASISCGAFAPRPASTPTEMPTLPPTPSPTQVPTDVPTLLPPTATPPPTPNAQPRIVVDQSCTADNNMSAEINSGFLFSAQTFTAGVDGVLAGITIDVNASSIGTYPLHVAIRTVDGYGRPSTTILGETTLDSWSAPPTKIISFPQTIPVGMGNRYAIVVNYQGGAEVKGKPLGMWQGATGDPYPGGASFASVSDGLTWTPVIEDGDFHFETLVLVGKIPGSDFPFPTDTPALPVPTGTIEARPPNPTPSITLSPDQVHLSVSIQGLTNEKDQLALTSGDNESHRYCFSGCRDQSDLVLVWPDKILVQKDYPITYDQWTVLLEVAPGSSYVKNALKVAIQYKNETWACVNDVDMIQPRGEYQIIYVAYIDPPNYDPPVGTIPPYFPFTCTKNK